MSNGTFGWGKKGKWEEEGEVEGKGWVEYPSFGWRRGRGRENKRKRKHLPGPTSVIPPNSCCP